MKITGTNAANIIEQQAVPLESTFVFNEKIAIIGTDDLEVYSKDCTDES